MESNGVDLDVWGEVKQAVRDDLEEAGVVVRTRHRWGGGFAVDGEAIEIESAGEVTPRTFEFRTDWPTDVGGQDSGPSPGEAILGALGGCVGLTYIANAVNRGVEIDQLEIAIEPRADLQGLFEGGNARPGFSDVDIQLSSQVRCRRTDVG